MMKRCSILMLLTVSIVGCGGTSRRPISGEVTYKGEPVKNGVITFLSQQPPGPVGGALIREGKYDIPAEQGLEPGTYGVSISYPGPPAQRTREEIEAGASARASELLPAKYNSETKLSLEVKASGVTRGDFRLE